MEKAGYTCTVSSIADLTEETVTELAEAATSLAW